MAAVSDLLPVIREIGLWTLIKRVVKETLDDHVFVYASALSYAWLFALFPMLIFLVSLLPFLPGKARYAGRRLIHDSIEAAFPGPAAEQILQNPKLASLLQSVFEQRRGALLSVSLVIGLYAASNGLSMVMTAFDRCYDLEKGRPFYKAKPISLLLTTVIVAMVLIVMTLIPLGTALRSWILDHGLTVPWLEIKLNWWFVLAFDIVRYVIGLALAFAILSIIYNFAHSVRMRWRLVSPGSIFCFFSWIALGGGFRFYLHLTGGTSYNQTFGPASGLAILMLVFFLYGVVLLIGAELNAEIDKVRLGVEPGTIDLRPAQMALRERIREAARVRRAEKAARRPPQRTEPVFRQPK